MACVHVYIIFTAFLCCMSSGEEDAVVNERQVNIPPLITAQPPRIIAFVVGESIELKCIASGTPDPEYRWEMDDREFSASGNDRRVAIQPDVGTLIFSDPILKDEGFYQCFATNRVGTAVTDVVYLRPARLDQFLGLSMRTFSPHMGEGLKLFCNRPTSYPNAKIFWGIISNTEIYEPVVTNDRVTVDPEGNLLFANIIASDAKGGRQYVCSAQNIVMRKIERGAYSVISPQGQTILNMKPEITWEPHTNQVALRGESLSIKCIFSGSPTPRVDWEQSSGAMSPRARTESYGQELVIDDVQFEDAGTYQCGGINTETTSAVRRSFNVEVQSAPYWVKRPESVDAAIGDTAVFHCQAYGVPAVEYYWFLNGVRIESTEVAEGGHRLLENTKLTFLNMSKDDALVVQCNATNKHGNVFANAYLSVLEEPPLIQIPPEVGQKAAESQTITLKCTVFGSPKPTIIWYKANEQLTGGRYKVLDHGDLQITDVSLVDAGTYTCTATNSLGTASATGGLIVRRQTLIQMAPQDTTVESGTEAKFTCTAMTDPEEAKNLVIDWKKDDGLIDYELAQRVFKNYMDNSLTISGLYTLDTGKYTCVASNGLDTAEASAQLVVQAPPSEATDIFVECFNSKKKATVQWDAGSENYAPILSYTLQYNTTFAPDTWIDYNNSIPQNLRSIEANLSAYSNYTFRVLARNKFGLSNPSRHSNVICTTEEDIPDKNPENVIGEGDQPDNLVIFWTPMPGIEQNGPTFSYIITWKRADIDDAELHTARVDRSDAWHYVVPDRQETYKKFNITVKAKNIKGEAKVPPETIVGHSGEDVPLVKPNDVAVRLESITATTAEITWTSVDTSPEMVRGFFRGYRVQYGTTADWPENVREQDFVINEPKQYPRARIKRDASKVVTYTLTNLPAYMSVTLHVRVLTKYYVGPPSNMLEFDTLEGEPGPPAMFDVHARGPTHFELRWEKPPETNGILIGYNISYQTITGLNLGRIQYHAPVTNPEQTNVKLTGLEPNTYYRVFLGGVTKKGRGEDIFLDMKTTESGAPQAPTFSITNLNETWVEVTWEPSHDGNPGSIFYVQYRPRGYYHYMHTPDEVIENKIDLFELDPGTTYQIRVVSKNGEGLEAPTSWQEFTSDGVAPGRSKLSTAAWFYGIWVSLFLIIIFLVIFFFLKRIRDRWWDTKEAEIEEQIRQLQAEEAAMQMGILNQYAQTGSREMINDPNRSGVSDYKQFADVEGEEFSENEFDPEPAKQYPQQQQQAAPPMMVKKGYPPSPEVATAVRGATYAPGYSPQPQSAGYSPQSPDYPAQSPTYSPQDVAPATRYANVPRGSQENLADPNGRFVTGSSHQLAPGQSIELRSSATDGSDTFV